jgi:pimeloyl-CoA dehydrogenase small subunit
MDFELSEEQRLLKESVDRLMAERYDFASRRRHAASEGGWSSDLWAHYAELGLLGLGFDEEDGGFGGGAVETMLVMEAFGRTLALEPYFSAIVLCGALLRHAADASCRAGLVPQIAAGTLRLAFAHEEKQSRGNFADVEVTARQAGGTWRLDGGKTLVVHGDSADGLLVTARSSGARRDRDGIGLFHVDAAQPGITRTGYRTQDGQRAADVILDGAAAVPLGDPGGALPAVEGAVDVATAALCAEAVGVMGAMHDLTLDYLKTRKQFGRALAEFQALQHRLVDMYVSLELARSMVLFATVMAEAEDATERRRAVAAAKVQIGRSGRHIGQEAIQLHGGIGMTMDYAVGHYFKRMTMIERSFGDTDQQLTTLARLGGLIAA